MSAWSWVIVGLAAYMGGSVVVAVALSAILRIVRRDEVEWEPEEPWASAPLNRERFDEEQEPLVPGAPAVSRGRSRVQQTTRAGLTASSRRIV